MPSGVYERKRHMKTYAHKTKPFRDQIFSLIDQGVGYNKIARRFDISRATLYELRKGGCHRHGLPAMDLSEAPKV